MSIISNFRELWWAWFGHDEKRASFWWLLVVRSPLHVLLGAMIAGGGLLLIRFGFPHYPTAIGLGAFWAFAIVWKEMRESEHQSALKTVVDVVSNLVGFSAVMVWA